MYHQRQYNEILVLPWAVHRLSWTFPTPCAHRSRRSRIGNLHDIVATKEQKPYRGHNEHFAARSTFANWHHVSAITLSHDVHHLISYYTVNSICAFLYIYYLYFMHFNKPSQTLPAQTGHRHHHHHQRRRRRRRRTCFRRFSLESHLHCAPLCFLAERRPANLHRLTPLTAAAAKCETTGMWSAHATQRSSNFKK